MWPFEHKPEDRLLPQLPSPTRQPAPYTDQERIAFLEVKCAQLEVAVRELCNAIIIQQEAHNGNFVALNTRFSKLVEYVMRPSRHIMGEQQDKN